MNEDCLALNIAQPPGGISGLHIVVWIHGGSYQNVSCEESVTCDENLISFPGILDFN
jgi:carboxylesterase type B